MNFRDKKGSITIFVLVGLLFMTSFLLISIGMNTNKLKVLKEQFNMLSGIYSPNNGDIDESYDEAYADMRQRTKETKTISSERNADTSVVELSNSYGESLVNYRIYGAGERVEYPNNYNLPEDYQELEYIESTGTQYIDSKVSSTNGVIMAAKVEFTNLSGYQIMGAEQGNPYKRNYPIGISGNKWYLGAYTYTTGGTLSANTIYEIEGSTILNNSYLKVNNEIVLTINNNKELTDKNLYIFASNGYSNKTKCKLYRLQIYLDENKNNLIRDFVPCYNKVDKELGMYDLVEGKFYKNSGTEEFLTKSQIDDTVGNIVTDLNSEYNGKYEIPIKITNKNGESRTYNIYLNSSLAENEYIDFATQKVYRNDGTQEDIQLPNMQTSDNYNKIKVGTKNKPNKIEITYTKYSKVNHNLPVEYQEVEYIESTGTQYIDTEYVRNNDTTSIEINYYKVPDKSKAGDAIFGDENNSRFLVRYNSGTLVYYGNFSGAKNLNGGVEGKNNIKIDFKNSKIYVNNIENDLKINALAVDSILLFTQSYNGKAYLPHIGNTKIYNFKIWENNELIINFIPCYRKSDNKAGMYDLVEGNFYTDANGGNFIAGPVV